MLLSRLAHSASLYRMASGWYLRGDLGIPHGKCYSNNNVECKINHLSVLVCV